MTKRDFFRLLIKIFGLFSSIIAFFRITGQGLSSIALSGNPIEVFLWVALVLIFTFGVYLFLILKTDFIINKLKLDKGFDDDKILTSGITFQEIIKIVTILIGGFLLISNIPSFIGHIILQIQGFYNDKNYFILENYPFYFDWCAEFVSMLIGFYFVVKYNTIAKFLNKN